jgi:hypothetical protein
MDMKDSLICRCAAVREGIHPVFRKQVGVRKVLLLIFLLGFGGGPRAGEVDAEQWEAGGIEYTGVWIARGDARAFVAVSPWPRVLRYLPRPCAEPMLNAGRSPFDTGIRTWFMEDGQQNPHAFRPASRPAEFLERGPSEVCIRSRWTGLPGYETAVILRAEILEDGSLRIRHGVQNLAPRIRNLAPWSITSFPVGGVIEMDFDRPEARTFALFGDTGIEDLARVLEPNRLRIDTAAVQRDDRALKFGVLAKSGEIRHHVNGQSWISRAPFSETGVYPDGGSNLTAFLGARNSEGGSWAEIEQVGVTRPLEPRESVWLEETITRPLPLSDPHSMKQR